TGALVRPELSRDGNDEAIAGEHRVLRPRHAMHEVSLDSANFRGAMSRYTMLRARKRDHGAERAGAEEHGGDGHERIAHARVSLPLDRRRNAMPLQRGTAARPTALRTRVVDAVRALAQRREEPLGARGVVSHTFSRSARALAARALFVRAPAATGPRRP